MGKIDINSFFVYTNELLAEKIKENTRSLSFSHKEKECITGNDK